MRAAIAQWQDAWTWPRQAARVKADKLHLTLHFLGEVAAVRIPELARELRLPFNAFALELGQPAIWPNGVAVLQPHATPAALRNLHAALGARLAGLDVSVEKRPYRPHITLARRAHAAQPPPAGPALDWPVDDGYVLVRSAGSQYEVIERF